MYAETQIHINSIPRLVRLERTKWGVLGAAYSGFHPGLTGGCQEWAGFLPSALCGTIRVGKKMIHSEPWQHLLFTGICLSHIKLLTTDFFHLAAASLPHTQILTAFSLMELAFKYVIIFIHVISFCEKLKCIVYIVL